MKKIGKRGFALLLAVLLLCLPLGLESVSAADDTPLAGVDGVVDIWKWTKVKTQADLPDARPTRTVGSTTETYDYALLLTYEYKGQKYFLDLGAENRKPFRGADVKDAFWMPATPLPDSVDTSLDTFRTKGNIGHMSLRPTGKKDSDNNCKVYHIYDESGSDQLYMVGGNFPDAFDVGLCFYSSSYISGIYSGVLANGLPDWSFCTHDAESSHVSEGKTKIFMNLSGSYDGCLDIDSKNGGSKISSPGSWSFQAFDVYVGVKEQWSAIRSNYTIKSGMVANYNGYIYVEPNVTITVEEGGVLSSSGVLYNNGTILNKGGTVLVQPNASIEQFCLGSSPGGYLECRGGDLVILKGGSVTAREFYMRSGATCTNFGALAVSGTSAYLIDGATIDNRSSGAVFFGVTPKSRYAGNFSSLTSDGPGSRDVYDVKPAYYQGLTPVPCRIVVGDDVMLYNEGRVYSAAYMYRNGYYSGYDSRYVGAKNITCKGSGKLYMYESVKKINDALNYENCLSEWSSKIVEPFYYLVLFESDQRQLTNQIASAMDTLRAAEMSPKRLNDKELAVFLKYTNEIDFDEHDIDRIAPEDYAQWAMPQIVNVKARTVEINHIMTHNLRMVTYPTAVGDAWLASVMSLPGTKVVVKCRPMERTKAIRGIDRSLQELRGQYMATGVDSRRMELQSHIETLSELLATLQQDNESLLETNVYVTAYDIAATRANHNIVQPPKSERTVITNMKKTVRRYYQENGFRLNNMEFDQIQAFIGSQVSGYDPMLHQGRGIPSNSLAACFPWVFAHVSDVGGIKLGSSEGVPVFIDFFRRDSERVNSNMVIVGKSGSGKSYATKSLLANLAAEDCKIFILDPENEYTELAENLHGKFINVGNAQFGRLNPFHIITALDDDESDGSTVSGSYATHLQFLEEFFKQILPDCERDAMEYLNSLIDRMYTNHGITGETDLSKLRPEDYPVFDDLYDAVLSEFQQTDNEYIRTILRTLMNYVAKFSTGGRNANIWNGPSTVTTDENFTVFNFQSLLSNRNGTIANAQMLLVLKYIDNEIIKNRDYNTKYGLHRKVVVVIDEAHVFIDTKFPVALDFMFQLAKRIRKYNGSRPYQAQHQGHLHGDRLQPLHPAGRSAGSGGAGS